MAHAVHKRYETLCHETGNMRMVVDSEQVTLGSQTWICEELSQKLYILVFSKVCKAKRAI